MLLFSFLSFYPSFSLYSPYPSTPPVRTNLLCICTPVNHKGNSDYSHTHLNDFRRNETGSKEANIREWISLRKLSFFQFLALSQHTSNRSLLPSYSTLSFKVPHFPFDSFIHIHVRIRTTATGIGSTTRLIFFFEKRGRKLVPNKQLRSSNININITCAYRWTKPLLTSHQN